MVRATTFPGWQWTFPVGIKGKTGPHVIGGPRIYLTKQPLCLYLVQKKGTKSDWCL